MTHWGVNKWLIWLNVYIYIYIVIFIILSYIKCSYIYIYIYEHLMYDKIIYLCKPTTKHYMQRLKLTLERLVETWYISICYLRTLFTRCCHEAHLRIWWNDVTVDDRHRQMVVVHDEDSVWCTGPLLLSSCARLVLRPSHWFYWLN